MRAHPETITLRWMVRSAFFEVGHRSLSFHSDERRNEERAHPLLPHRPSAQEMKNDN